MKKSIREDQERIILEQQYLDDNNLLEYRIDDSDVSIVVRYIEYNKINEIKLAKITFDDYMNNLNQYVEINKDNTAVAIYAKDREDDLYLRTIFKPEDHSLSYSEFLDIEYDTFFKNKNKTYIK